ncbi:hypothetical protein Ppa06_01840 [Planomonospora parontospora subsp. parontospora]|uniref:Uncharacterized protein n=2 Tax=Planomonospora parontospora TaxID=58119 RepID=A0AA37F276_9ACTN|nr:hypothetical protein [Planomonospora parontospora]GGK45835.1 hypothetical protein GCM10010126_01850 [Planomonospora parontospora]GII06386.1 hypothetical protein Ppa06_01840 [Planomonospora parontospora subsp. parontospora]
MFKDSADFRRVASGVLLIVAPLLQAIAVILDPGTWGDEREAVSFGDDPVLAQVQSVLYHWAYLLMALAALGLLHVMRRRAAVFGHIAGPLVILGYINLSGLLMADPVEWWLGRHHSPEEATRIMDEMVNLPGVIFGFQMPWIFFAIFGMPVLAVGAWRAGFAHWWIPLVLAVGYGGSMFVGYGPATVVLWGIPVAALGALGVRMLRMSRDEWISYYPTASTAVASAPAAGVGA